MSNNIEQHIRRGIYNKRRKPIDLGNALIVLWSTASIVGAAEELWTNADYHFGKSIKHIEFPIPEVGEIGAGLPIQSLISDNAPGVRMLRRNPQFVQSLRNAFSSCGEGRMEITINRSSEDNKRTAVTDCRKP